MSAKGLGAIATPAGADSSGEAASGEGNAAPAPLARDPRRFEALFLGHYRRVHGILRRLLGSDEEAEDAAQEVFLRLYRQGALPPDDEGLGRWLARVATNVGLNVLRGDRRHAARLQRRALLDRVDEAGRQEHEDPARAVLAREEVAAIRAALDSMAERPRTCLLLRNSGLSYAEIAAALGVAPGSVGTILARAERDFRRRYLAMNAEQGEAPGGPSPETTERGAWH
jgi:RNA polymerase sigma-70 factor (ECF subfamily)